MSTPREKKQHPVEGGSAYYVVSDPAPYVPNAAHGPAITRRPCSGTHKPSRGRNRWVRSCCETSACCWSLPCVRPFAKTPAARCALLAFLLGAAHLVGGAIAAAMYCGEDEDGLGRGVLRCSVGLGLLAVGAALLLVTVGAMCCGAGRPCVGGGGARRTPAPHKYPVTYVVQPHTASAGPVPHKDGGAYPPVPHKDGGAYPVVPHGGSSVHQHHPGYPHGAPLHAAPVHFVKMV